MSKNDGTKNADASFENWKKRIAGFLLSQNISMFGSSIVGYSIIWYITLETSSGYWMMWATICMVGPQLLTSLFGGVWADRYNRKLMIILADGFIALATLVLAVFFLMGYKSLVLVLIVSMIRSIGGGVQAPAVSAIYPQLVPKEELVRIQGINQTLSSILQLLAPAAGGVILGLFGIVGAFFVDVITASLAILVFCFIHVGKISRKDEITTIFGELKQGLSYSFSDIRIKRLIIVYAVAFFLFTPAMTLSPLLVERTFGAEVWRLTVNEMVWGIGSLLGGIFVSIKGDFKDKLFIIALSLFAFGVTFTFLGVAGNFILFLIIMGIAGFFLPLFVTADTVYIQEIVPEDRLGRVFSIIQLISGSAMPIAIIIFGPLADVISVQSIMIASGALVTLVSVVFHFGNRRIEKLHGN